MVVGFSSPCSFSSRFRELVGESPSQYRDRWAADGGPRIPGCFLFMNGVNVSGAPAASAMPEKRRPAAVPTVTAP